MAHVTGNVLFIVTGRLAARGHTHDDHMLMLGVYVSKITTHATTIVLYSYQNTTTIKAIKLYYNDMITTEAYIVGNIMKLGTLTSVCLRLVTQLSSSVGEASHSTLSTQSWHCDLTSRMAHGSLKIISTYATRNYGVYGEDHNPTRKGLETVPGIDK